MPYAPMPRHRTMTRTTTHCDACALPLAGLDFWIVPTVRGPRIACDSQCAASLKAEAATASAAPVR